MICTNDLLIIIGSIIKQLIESKSIVGDMWDVCSLMLGEKMFLTIIAIINDDIMVTISSNQAPGTFWSGSVSSDISASSKPTTS